MQEWVIHRNKLEYLFGYHDRRNIFHYYEAFYAVSMFDSHYYMVLPSDSDDDLSETVAEILSDASGSVFFCGQEPLLYATGGNFSPYPGFYLLPNGEGSYEVSYNRVEERFDVLMNTKGSGQVYEHPLSTWIYPIDEINTGWYTLFRDVIQISNLRGKLVAHNLDRTIKTPINQGKRHYAKKL